MPAVLLTEANSHTLQLGNIIANYPNGQDDEPCAFNGNDPERTDIYRVSQLIQGNAGNAELTTVWPVIVNGMLEFTQEMPLGMVKIERMTLRKDIPEMVNGKWWLIQD